MALLSNLEHISEELRSPDEETRRFAVVELVRHPLELSMPLLFIAMGDESWRVRKEAVAVLAQGKPGPEAVEGLISLLRASDNAGLRNSAVESLERLGEVAVEPLCRYLHDPDHDLRKFVIDILGSIRCTSCVPLLVQALEDADPNVRVAAAENLGKLGDPVALPHLLKVLEGQEVWLKFTVLDALALIGAPVPLSTLTPLVQERLLKRAVYDCLGVLGDAASIPVLLQGLQEKGKAQREAAAVALMRVRARLADEEQARQVDLPLKSLKETAAVEGICSSLRSAEAAHLESLVRLTGIIGDERATLPLLAVAAEERTRLVSLEAIRALGAAAVPQLLAHFGSADYEGRVLAAHLLGELACGEAVDLLVAALSEDGPELRAASVGSLGKLAPEGACARVAGLLDDSHPQVRAAAVEALQRLSTSDAAGVAALCANLVHSPLGENRRQAALLLAGLGDAERLSLLAKDEDAAVRRAAVASLAKLKLPETVGPLAMALADEDPEVRVAAAQALSEIGTPEVLDPLILALADSDPWVQSAALKGLSALGERAALPAVKSLLSCAQGPVLIAALSTVAAIGGAEERSAVRSALDHGDEEVVEAAIGILATTGCDWVEEHFQALMGHRHWAVRRAFVRAVAHCLGDQALPVLEQALAGEADSLVKGEITALMGGLGDAIH
jgi:HEAT repeat protein